MSLLSTSVGVMSTNRYAAFNVFLGEREGLAMQRHGKQTKILKGCMLYLLIIVSASVYGTKPVKCVSYGSVNLFVIQLGLMIRKCIYQLVSQRERLYIINVIAST
jgi:hypothetical protein